MTLAQIFTHPAAHFIANHRSCDKVRSSSTYILSYGEGRREYHSRLVREIHGLAITSLAKKNCQEQYSRSKIKRCMNQTHRMHNTSIVKIILLNDMGRCTIHQAGKCSTRRKVQRPIHKFTFPSRGSHMRCEFGNGSNRRMTTPCYSTPKPIHKKVLCFLNDIIWKVGELEIRSPASQSLCSGIDHSFLRDILGSHF